MTEVIKPNNSINVESYWIEQCKHGIIHLCINTIEIWMPYHQYNSEMYLIGEDEDNDFEQYKRRLLHIPKESFGFENGKLYIPTTIQNKDQISYYFIPFELIKKH